MGHYFFVKDLKDGKVAERVVSGYFLEKYLSKSGGSIRQLPREEQDYGDFEMIYESSGQKITKKVEVKFDRMAKETGNMCFEVQNKKGDLTGIAKTKADIVTYLVPKDEMSVYLYTFDTKTLKEYLFNSTNLHKFRVVKGGDRRAYSLMLVPIETLTEDSVYKSVEEINAEL